MRTGPQGAKRPEPQGDQRERDSPTRRAAPSVSDCRVRAAVEASPAPCRAQRRAGANLGGRDWRQRSAAQWTPDATAGSMPAAFRAALLPRRPSARPDRTPPDAAQAEEEADGVTARRLGAERARRVPLGSLTTLRTTERLTLNLQPRPIIWPDSHRFPQCCEFITHSFGHTDVILEQLAAKVLQCHARFTRFRQRAHVLNLILWEPFLKSVQHYKQPRFYLFKIHVSADAP